MVYPTLSELQTRLTDDGITAPSSATLTNVLAAAQWYWEETTGFRPFLADTVDSDWLFTPDGTNLLDFQGGFVSVTSVTTDIIYGNAAGIAAVSGRDYALRPANAVVMGKPYTYLQFRLAQNAGYEASVKVTGKRGYMATLTSQIYEAVMQQSIAFIVAERALQVSGGMVSWTEAAVTESYGGANSPFAVMQSALTMNFKQIASLYRRLRVV